jgi:hypothetical protein
VESYSSDFFVCGSVAVACTRRLRMRLCVVARAWLGCVALLYLREGFELGVAAAHRKDMAAVSLTPPPPNLCQMRTPHACSQWQPPCGPPSSGNAKACVHGVGAHGA